MLVQVSGLKPDNPTCGSLERGAETRHEAHHFPCFSVKVATKGLGPLD